MKILKIITGVKSVAVNHGISFKSSLDCDYIININQQIHEMVVGSGFAAQKSFIIPNMINVEEPYQERQLKEPMVIGMYGRIELRKGFDLLFSAAKILQEQGIDFRLKIGGFEVPGEYNWQTLKDLAEKAEVIEKCNFVGVVYDKKDFFKDVDIFIVPSREEPFGLVILEGFANSVLTISSNTEGGKILIEDEKNGLLFEKEQPLIIAQKIAFVKKNQDKYANYTKNAYEKLVNNYGFEVFLVNFGQFLAVFDKK